LLPSPQEAIVRGEDIILSEMEAMSFAVIPSTKSKKYWIGFLFHFFNKEKKLLRVIK
jgi:hypothetical protein